MESGDGIRRWAEIPPPRGPTRALRPSKNLRRAAPVMLGRPRAGRPPWNPGSFHGLCKRRGRGRVLPPHTGGLEIGDQAECRARGAAGFGTYCSRWSTPSNSAARPPSSPIWSSSGGRRIAPPSSPSSEPLISNPQPPSRRRRRFRRIPGPLPHLDQAPTSRHLRRPAVAPASSRRARRPAGGRDTAESSPGSHARGSSEAPRRRRGRPGGSGRRRYAGGCAG